MTNAVEVFDREAADYERQRRRLVPPFDAFYGTAVAALDLAGRPMERVLDLGAGTGLDDAGKRDLFARVHAVLAPGGVLVDAEQVTGPTALFADAYAAWHARRAAECGATPEEWAASVARQRLDRWASVEHQLTWLRDAGFADADCLFKDHGFAVLVARRSG